ncbi:MAG: V-type ATP synthase subunit A, partial [Gemmatimonadota bacterium]|nr:V-type ATP synthase subunit A [Gemmatimonadota bacterium]
VRGEIDSIEDGLFTVDQPICRLKDGTELCLFQEWPVRVRRPIERRLTGNRPFLTGQRIFDFFFPVAEGGAVAVPGGFGTGKTVIEQSLAKFADADVVVYVACGERGNEAADVLEEFAELVDPRTGRSVSSRAVMVVNTSNMPVAARDASVYLGMTIAEYFRDMGYRVAVMADSLSRWAEALREVSAKLEDMPGEEGYPTYLGGRLSQLVERAGRAKACGKPRREGTVTFVSAISPPGGDFSEPVTRASLQVSGALWALDPNLAHSRHFPAVDWGTSYTLYEGALEEWFKEQGYEDWVELRGALLQLLERDQELREIAGLIGVDAMEDKDRVVLDVVRILRDAVMTQSAFDANDAFSSIDKTFGLAKLVKAAYDAAVFSIESGTALSQLDLASVSRALMAVRAAAPETVMAEFANARAAVTKMREGVG